MFCLMQSRETMIQRITCASSRYGATVLRLGDWVLRRPRKFI